MYRQHSSLDDLTDDHFQESYFMGLIRLNISLWEKLSFAEILPQSPHNSTDKCYVEEKAIHKFYHFVDYHAVFLTIVRDFLNKKINV